MLLAKQVQALSCDKGVQAILLVVQHVRFRAAAAGCEQRHLKHRSNMVTESSSVTTIVCIVIIIDMISLGTVVMAGLLWQELL